MRVLRERGGPWKRRRSRPNHTTAVTAAKITMIKSALSLGGWTLITTIIAMPSTLTTATGRNQAPRSNGPILTQLRP